MTRQRRQQWLTHDSELEMQEVKKFSRPRPRRLFGGIGLVLVGALVMSACATRKQYGVPTTLIAGKGNCDTSRQVEVGAALDLSGPQAALGKAYLQGIQLGIQHVDNSGGILKNHSCLELLYKNTEGNIHVADTAVLDLVNDEVVTFMVGPFVSSEVQFSGGDLGLSGVPTTSLSSLDITTNPKTFQYVFPTVPTEAVSAQVAAAYAKSHGLTSVAVIGENNPAGHEGVSEFASQASKDGLTLTGKADGSNYSSELQNLQSGNPQLLYVAGDDLGVANILKARQALGWKVPVVAEEVASFGSVVSSLGSSGTAGVSVIAPKAAVVSGPSGTPSDPAVAAFLSQVKKKVGTLSGSVALYAQAADSVELFAYVATSINSTLPGNVRTFIENANYQGMMFSYGYTSSYHEGVAPRQLLVEPLSDLSGGLFHT